MSRPPYTPKPYDPPLHRVLHIEVDIGPEDQGIARVWVDPEIHYGAAWAHGGVVGTMADVASGVAVAVARERRRDAVEGTIEMKVNFLRKVVDGDITATARVVHLGRRIAVTEVDVTNKGDLCAKAVGTFMLRPADTLEPVEPVPIERPED